MQQQQQQQQQQYELAPLWYRLLGFGSDWADFSQPAPPGSRRPQPLDLLLVLPCSVLLLLLRYAIVAWLLRPLGRRLGLSDKQVVLSGSFADKAASLEPHFRRQKRPDGECLRRLSSELGFSERSIANWFRQRRNKGKPSQLQKFCECAWSGVYYTVFFCFGLAIQWREPYFIDSDHLWLGWPQHYVSGPVFWYCLLQLSFYCSSIVTLAVDVKRKDFWEMAVHHAVTVLLIVTAWLLNFTRVSAFTLLVHDAVDPVLNFGKVATYCAPKRVSDAFGVALVVVWFTSRIAVLPVRIVYSVYADSLRLMRARPSGMHSCFIAGFVVLQLLHTVWTCYLLRMIFHVLRHGDAVGDTRSDSEISDDDEEERKEK